MNLFSINCQHSSTTDDRTVQNTFVYVAGLLFILNKGILLLYESIVMDILQKFGKYGKEFKFTIELP